MSEQMPKQRPLTQRVEVGSYYTDGDELWEVGSVCALGLVVLVNVRKPPDDSEVGPGYREVGIDAFRRKFWLVKGPVDE